MIQLTNITVAYGKNIVYQNFSHTFNNGVNVLLGKSGCGKTTLINVIAGLIPYGGSCQTQGKISVVFQQPSLAPVSVFNNVNLVLPRGDNSQKINRYLQLAQILPKKDQNARSLSGGEQQRVALARAFAAETPILLLDEPFSNLDYGVKVQLNQTFDALLAQTQKTVLLATHDIDQALALADNIFLLSGSPCQISSVARVSALRNARSEFDPYFIDLKRTLRKLLL